MEIVAAESTNLFIGTEEAPRQVVRVVLRGSAGRGPRARPGAHRGRALRTEEPRHHRAAAAGRGGAARGRRRGRRGPTPPASILEPRSWSRTGPSPVRHPFQLRRRRAGLADVHDLALPLRPGLVEHAGRLHRDLGRRDPVPGAVPGARPRPRQGAPRDGPARPGLQVRARRARLPQAVLGRLSRGSRLHPASSWPRVGWSSWAARTTSRTRT